MGQTVDAGIGGQAQRHRQGQLEIDDRRGRAAGEPGDQHLFVGLGVGDDREARHLRAGAGGRRDGDDRQADLRDVVRHLVVAHLAAIGVQHRHALGGVDRAAAADRDQAVIGRLAQPLDADGDNLGRRVGDGVLKHRPRASSRRRAAPVARSRMPLLAINGSVTISGCPRPSRAISAGNSPSAPPPTDNSRGVVINAAIEPSLLWPATA